MDQCRSCGRCGRLYTAPGGAMVCEGCLDIIQRINLVRLRGASEDAIAQAMQRTIKELENELDKRCDEETSSK